MPTPQSQKPRVGVPSESASAASAATAASGSASTYVCCSGGSGLKTERCVYGRQEKSWKRGSSGPSAPTSAEILMSRMGEGGPSPKLRLPPSPVKRRALSEFVSGFAGNTKPRRLSSGASSRGSRLSDVATRPVE